MHRSLCQLRNSKIAHMVRVDHITSRKTRWPSTSLANLVPRIRLLWNGFVCGGSRKRSCTDLGHMQLSSAVTTVLKIPYLRYEPFFRPTMSSTTTVLLNALISISSPPHHLPELVTRFCNNYLHKLAHTLELSEWKNCLIWFQKNPLLCSR